jgi:hypothetical protein
MIGVNEITISPITNSPLFERAKHISEEQSAVEYKRVASTSTHMIGIFPFVERIAATLRSIVQMRYASSPGHSFYEA